MRHVYLVRTVLLDLIIVIALEVCTWKKVTVRSVLITFTATLVTQIVLLVQTILHRLLIRHSALALLGITGILTRVTVMNVPTTIL